MAKIKIFLDQDETQADAEDALYKALNHHASGDVHDKSTFNDPAMVDVINRMEQTHKEIYQDMLNEIFMELDKNYTK